MITLKIKTFRAVDDKESSLRFAKGHSNVLEGYGIPKIASSDIQWVENPNVHVLLVESLDGTEVYGGAKIHTNSHEYLLPLEEAVGEIDPKIHELIEKFPPGKTGELCGLWNSRKMSGSGLSSILVRAAVAKSGIVLAHQLKLDSLFALCAPWTIKMFEDSGYRIEETIGYKGTFLYPKDDLVATVMVIEDLYNLNSATEFNKNRIYKLRLDPIQISDEDSPKGKLSIEYNLLF